MNNIEVFKDKESSKIELKILKERQLARKKYYLMKEI